MPIKKYNPTSAGRRNSSVDAFKDITKFEPEKSLIFFRASNGGRNNTGKITVRHRGGGARRYTRTVDFVSNKFDVPATVAAIEYDPARGSSRTSAPKRGAGAGGSSRARCRGG